MPDLSIGDWLEIRLGTNSHPLLSATYPVCHMVHSQGTFHFVVQTKCHVRRSLFNVCYVTLSSISGFLQKCKRRRLAAYPNMRCDVNHWAVIRRHWRRQYWRVYRSTRGLWRIWDIHHPVWWRLGRCWIRRRFLPSPIKVTDTFNPWPTAIIVSSFYRSKNKEPKKRKLSGKKVDHAKLIEEISVACSFCTKSTDPLQTWEQNKFDRIMSKHLWAKEREMITRRAFW